MMRTRTRTPPSNREEHDVLVAPPSPTGGADPERQAAVPAAAAERLGVLRCRGGQSCYPTTDANKIIFKPSILSFFCHHFCPPPPPSGTIPSLSRLPNGMYRPPLRHPNTHTEGSEAASKNKPPLAHRDGHVDGQFQPDFPSPARHSRQGPDHRPLEHVLPSQGPPVPGEWCPKTPDRKGDRE